MPQDITAPTMLNNITIMECPKCRATKQVKSVPGLLHTYVMCERCTIIRVQRFGAVDAETSGV